MKNIICIIVCMLLVSLILSSCSVFSRSHDVSTTVPLQSDNISSADISERTQTDMSESEHIGSSDEETHVVTLPWEISEPFIDYMETEKSEVSLELVTDSLTAYGAEFRMSNLSNKNLQTGNSFVIEVFLDGKWNYIDIGIVMFPAEALNYEAGHTYNVSIDWTNYYGELVPADYRIIKEYLWDGASNDYCYCICEFTIE